MTVEPPIRRRSTSLEEDLVAEARRLGINLSRGAEAGLRRGVAEEAAWRWQAENDEGIRQVNAYVAEHGLPMAKYRLF